MVVGLTACGVVLGVGARRARADAAPAAGEQVPRVFTYRGQLSLDSGASAGTSKLLRFALHRSVSGATPEFTESKIVTIDPTVGAFATDIGECTASACSGSLQAVLEAPSPGIYLAVSVCSGTYSTANDCSAWVELGGRQRLLSSVGAVNTSGQIVGYARSSAGSGCITGNAGSWVMSTSSLNFVPPVRSRLVVRYVANVQGSGSVSAAVGSTSPFGFMPLVPEALATAKSAITYEGTALSGGNTIEHTFVLTGQTDPLDVILGARTSSGTPRLCDDGSSYIEVTAYAE